jgi:hypothetical protein
LKTCFDSSAFAKRYILEPGSTMVDSLCQQATELGLCVLCVPEIISALNRRVREGVLPQSDYITAKGQLAADVGSAAIIHLTPDVIGTAVHLFETNVLRAMDALHVAGAVEWEADLFVTADHRQLAAAQKANLNVQLV